MDFTPTSITQGTLPTVTDILRDDGNAVVDLTGCTVQFILQQPDATVLTRTATVTDAAGGAVSYTFASGETDAPGAYLARWRVTLPDTTVRYYPPASGVFQATATDVLMKWPDGTWHRVTRTEAAGQFLWDVEQANADVSGWVELTVAASADVTLISDLYEPIRALLGDFAVCANGQVIEYQYPDRAVDGVVRSMVRMGKLADYGTFGVTPNRTGISPGLPSVGALALLVYESAHTLILPNAAAYEYRMRALSERFGAPTDFLFELQNQLYDLRNPGGSVRTFQQFYGWVNALTGLNLYAVLTDFKNTGSLATVTLGPGGMNINTR